MNLLRTPLRDWPAEDFANLLSIYRQRGGILEKDGVRVMFCRPNDETFMLLTSGELEKEEGREKFVQSHSLASFWEGPHWYNMVWSSDGARHTWKMAHYIESLLAEGAHFAYHSGEACREWIMSGGKLRRLRRRPWQQSLSSL